MNFKSDNVGGVHPKIMQAIVDANKGSANSYGHDASTERLTKVLSEVFEHEVFAYMTSTGTASNCLALSAICPNYGTIYTSCESHMLTDENNAPQLFTGGAKIVSFSDEVSLIDLKEVEKHINSSYGLRPHASLPSAISIAQTTEYGRVYTLEKLKEVSDLAKKYNLKVHMDGARFTNALVALNCTPAEMTWKTGVDVLTFGATKNGALLGEVIIFFDRKLAENFDYVHKRSGQLFSKARFFSEQLIAYFKDDLWLELARHSNRLARKLRDGLKEEMKSNIFFPVDANEIFVKLTPEQVQYLFDQGVEFYDWDLSQGMYRWVTHWDTTDQEVEDFLNILSKL